MRFHRSSADEHRRVIGSVDHSGAIKSYAYSTEPSSSRAALVAGVQNDSLVLVESLIAIVLHGWELFAPDRERVLF
jgi:hypothetical protein